VQAGIDEIDIGKILVGQSASVIAEAYPQLKFSGKIVRIHPEAKIEQNVTLFDVVVEVENEDGMLKSGMNTTIEITIIKKENVLLAHTPSLLNVAEKSKGKNIWMVNLKQGAEYVNKEVEIGLYDFKYAEVLSGLKQGDILGVPMTSRLKDENDRLMSRIRNRTGFNVSGSRR
jgi:HlyD family secretion protein